jgi:hypothetical protein
MLIFLVGDRKLELLVVDAFMFVDDEDGEDLSNSAMCIIMQRKQSRMPHIVNLFVSVMQFKGSISFKSSSCKD